MTKIRLVRCLGKYPGTDAYIYEVQVNDQLVEIEEHGLRANMRKFFRDSDTDMWGYADKNAIQKLLTAMVILGYEVELQ